MRSLDRKFVTPVLREHNLVSLNADGFMMTRSLAENYPYTSLYKAKLKGARNEWLELVDQLENRETSALDSLKFMLSKLINRAKHFDHKANELIYETSKLNLKIHTRDDAISVIQFHMEQVDYASRLLEIGMHALGQAAIESGSLEPMTLKPLSQMRSANKKHGNIGDIEFLEQGEIVESWDAKYGKSYLREELEELNEKLRDHEHLELAGFVTTEEPERLDEIVGRAKSIEELYSIKIVVFQFRSWVDFIYEKVTQTELISEAELSRRWIHIYCLCLCQKRRDHAPIDEPCLNWVEALISQLRDME
ncbi:MAG: hypothetical protein OXC62_07065 [Aestuariivita sp.]|nr:hypothetical protein [Aestuariivita sp.]